MWGEGIGWRLLWRFAVAPLPKLAEAEIHTPNLAMTDSETVLYTADMLLELRNMTSLHPKLRFLTYLLEMAFREAFMTSVNMNLGFSAQVTASNDDIDD